MLLEHRAGSVAVCFRTDLTPQFNHHYDYKENNPCEIMSSPVIAILYRNVPCIVTGNAAVMDNSKLDSLTQSTLSRFLPFPILKPAIQWCVPLTI